MTQFSMELDEDQHQIRKWVHDFAEDVMRPAGREWDEREETPWPIIEEAASIGLYSLDFCSNAFADPSGRDLLLTDMNKAAEKRTGRQYDPGNCDPPSITQHETGNAAGIVEQ